MTPGLFVISTTPSLFVSMTLPVYLLFLHTKCAGVQLRGDVDR